MTILQWKRTPRGLGSSAENPMDDDTPPNVAFRCLFNEFRHWLTNAHMRLPDDVLFLVFAWEYMGVLNGSSLH
jgi:hypothetical protein